MATDEEINCYNEIISRGCCKRCALRYFGHDKSLMCYDFPTTSLVNMGLLPPEEEFEPPFKRKKVDPCVVCLGVLQDPVIDEMMLCEELKKGEEYKHETFSSSVTFPACILIRDHSMKVHLKKNFPSFNMARAVKVSQAWRLSTNDRLRKVIGKQGASGAKLVLHFYIDYPLEHDEIEVVEDYIKTKLEQSQLSRHAIGSFLETVTDEVFSELVQVPPKEPLYSVTFKEIKYFSDPIFLLGNYCKYSRQMKLPVTTGNEETVESIITKVVNKLIPCETACFKASSYDEYDVRVVGKGRSFQVHIHNPKVEGATNEVLREIEKRVNKVKTVEIKNLRISEKREVTVVMDSENLSPKSYKILCKVHNFKNLDSCVNAINSYSRFKVAQKTPLRLLHQRRYYIRKRKVFYIKAAKVGDNLIEVDLCAQCGLYIHEFITGDMGRSTPSLSDIIKAKADVLALDLVDLLTTLECLVDEHEVII